MIHFLLKTWSLFSQVMKEMTLLPILVAQKWREFQPQEDPTSHIVLSRKGVNQNCSFSGLNGRLISRRRSFARQELADCREELRRPDDWRWYLTPAMANLYTPCKMNEHGTQSHGGLEDIYFFLSNWNIFLGSILNFRGVNFWGGISYL